jgi:F-type H+-transporting ATPase subunit delta
VLDKSVAITFVNALLEIAAKKGLMERIEKDLALVSDVITKHGKLEKTLFHPSITRNEKKKLIKKVFGASVSDLMVNFLNLLVDRRRERIVEFLPAIYKETVDASKGVINARVTTVAPLTESQMSGLKKRLDKLTGKNVEIEVVQDPQILGGILIRVGNKMIDGSIAGRLKNLRTRLLELRTA